MICMNMSNNVILNTLNVPIINDFGHLAEQLSLTQELLYFLAYKKQYCYTQKEIPKKDGTSRILYVPHLALKVDPEMDIKRNIRKNKCFISGDGICSGEERIKS